MITIQAITINETLQATVLPTVPCNNQNTVRLHVDFDSNWNGYAKTAVFYTSKNPTPYEVVFTPDNMAYVPVECLTEETYLIIGVKGVSTTTAAVKTSTVLRYKVAQGTPLVLISDPKASVYNQLLTAYGELAGRLSNAIGGGTPDGSELSDVRVAADGTVYKTAGDSVRQQNKIVTDLANKPSLYSLDIVKEYMGLEEVFNGSLSYDYTDSAAKWKYTSVDVPLPAGNYILIIRDSHLPEGGYIAVNEDPSHVPFIEVTEAGIYEFTVYDNTYSTDDNVRCVKMQISEGNGVAVGSYYASGITIYKNTVLDGQAFPDRVVGLDKVVKKQIGKNIVNPAILTEGYYIDGGGREVAENPEYEPQYMSDFIEIEGGETYAFYDTNIGGACIAFYDVSKTCILAMNNASTDIRLHTSNGIVTAPENAKYLRISGRAVNMGIAMVSKGNTRIPFEPYTEYAPLYELEKRLASTEDDIKRIVPADMELKAAAETLAAGESLSISTETHTKWGYSIGLNCNIADTFGGLTLSRGKTNPYCCGYITVDGSNIKVYEYTTEAVLLKTLPHGLNISKFLYCNIHANDNDTAKVVLTSASGTFTADIPWNASRGEIAVETTSTLTECELTYGVNAIKKSVWLFGDSYFDSWPRVATSYGYNNFLEDAYSGRNSNAALASLKEYLKYQTPKKVVWFMGMNDTDVGAINETYKAVIEELALLCTQRGITLVLATVPSTPTRNNSYKNEYIKSLGYSYIDIDKAVGVNANGVWYDGLISGDNVHPSAVGKTVIANYVINALPEITG